MNPAIINGSQNGEWVGILIAPFIGSFVATAVQRFSRGEAFVGGRSHCDSCDHQLGATELIPIVSWFAQRGRCRGCGTDIGYWSPATEVTYLAITALTALLAPGSVFWCGCLLSWVLLALALTDLKTFLLPDLLTLPLIGCGIVITGFTDRPAIGDHMLAAAIGFVSLYAVAKLYRMRTGREGLGLGDAKLFAASGAWLGTVALPGTMLIAASSALCVELIRRRLTSQTRRGEPIAFGPFIAFATLSGWIVGPLVPVTQ